MHVLQLPQAMRMYGLTSLHEFWAPATDSRVLLAWSANTVLLTFRGTVSLQNARAAIRVGRMRTMLIRL